jgi:anaerobic magnesium-protoporphyrin IX monomethyl ester cyclase
MIVLFNPISTTPGKQPLPLSLMALAAVLEDRTDWRLIDGNIEKDPAATILAAFAGHTVSLLAVTVMPGPQVAQAVEVCRRVRETRPDIAIVWGGYFPTQHTETVMASPLVDFVIRSQGEAPLLQLIDILRSGGSVERVGGLSWKKNGAVVHNPLGHMTPLNELPELPYHRVDMPKYIHTNYLGRRTVAHNTSFGCPFACSFCAVGTMSHRRWLHHSPARMEGTLRHLQRTYGVDAVQMHDMDFFISEDRTADFAARITGMDMSWWALGRVDVLMNYSDATWRAMQRSGLKMIFSGAESGSDEQLAAMNKGGNASAHLTLELARRARAFGIIPEFSFVLGTPPDPLGNVPTTFEFIRKIKAINPAAEIVMYTYTPVVADGDLSTQASEMNFAFPNSLEGFAAPAWQKLSMRRGDGIPWMTREVQKRARNFERVLNAFYPTVTDPRLTGIARTFLRAAGGWRYALRLYGAPYELRALHRLMHYQRPETTGF